MFVGMTSLSFLDTYYYGIHQYCGGWYLQDYVAQVDEELPFDEPVVEQVGDVDASLELDAATIMEPSSRVKLNHPKENIIDDLSEGMRLRRKVLSQLTYISCVSQVEPKKVEEALKYDFWINVMHDELNQFVRNDGWYLVPRPANTNVIGTK